MMTMVILVMMVTMVMMVMRVTRVMMAIGARTIGHFIIVSRPTVLPL